MNGILPAGEWTAACSTDCMRPEAKVILIVDDAPANVQICHEILREDYQTRIATTPARALAVARQEPLPDLILLDVVMPEIDGYEVCSRLKADPVTRDIPVIFLTGQTEVEQETRGFLAGAVDYIHKPFSPPVIQARVRTHLALKEAMEQLTREKRRADQLLANILPSAAVRELHEHGKVKPRRFEDVAVLFCDLVGFTRYCDQHAPEIVVQGLGRLFVAFEACVRKHGLEKIKTVGDALMVTAGLLQPVENVVASAIACAGELSMIAQASPENWQVRAGIHVGPVVAGVVGEERFQFDVWGDTVNVAARLTSAGSVGKVVALEDVAKRFSLSLSDVRAVELKGKGMMRIGDVCLPDVPYRDNP